MCRRITKNQRDVVERAWQWFNPTLPRDVFEPFMPKSAYAGKVAQLPQELDHRTANQARDMVEYLQYCIDNPLHEGGEAFRNKSDDYKLRTREQEKAAALLRIAAKRRWPRKPFLVYDELKTGTISKQQFRIGLEKCGHYLSEEQAWVLATRFDVAQNGLVNYESFLTFVRNQHVPCSKHRVWGCGACVSYKKCIKCDCNCFKASMSGTYSASLYQKALICKTCGHTRSSHLLMPLDAIVSEYKEGQAYTAKQLRTMLEFDGVRHLPPGVKGIKDIPDTKLLASYNRIDLKAALNEVNDSVIGEYAITPFQKDSENDNRAAIAFKNLYEDIIGNIMKASEGAINDLDGSLGWNFSTDPARTRIGGALLHSEKGTGKIRSVGQAEANPPLSKQALERLHTMAAEEAAARALVEADPRSSARKIRQRLIEARMENKMLAPLIAHNKAKTDGRSMRLATQYQLRFQSSRAANFACRLTRWTFILMFS